MQQIEMSTWNCLSQYQTKASATNTTTTWDWTTPCVPWISKRIYFLFKNVEKFPRSHDICISYQSQISKFEMFIIVYIIIFIVIRLMLGAIVLWSEIKNKFQISAYIFEI